MTTPLRIGFVGTGFIAGFHLRALLSVRNVEISGVYSPSAAHREAFADKVNALELGPCSAYASLAELLLAPGLDAVWLLAPNDQRLAVMREIHEAVRKKRCGVRAIACEKPLGRTLSVAIEMLDLAADAGILHGYLENQLFSSAVVRGHDIIWRRAVPATGRPYLARAAEEHSGPHAAWFWKGDLQGGGVMSDMMCLSVEVGRFLLTGPGAPRSSLALRSLSGHVSHLKWQRPSYAAPEGAEAIVEASTSLAYVGPGLRLDLALLGP